MIASRTGDGTSPIRRPRVKPPTIDLFAICHDETADLAQEGEAAIASATGEATVIVGRLTARAKLPASLMFARVRDRHGP
jgi:hypothetical protein